MFLLKTLSPRFIILFFLLPLLAGGNPLFYQYCDSLKQLTSQSRFAEAEVLLPILDSLAAVQKNQELDTDLLFYKGYFLLFRDGQLPSFELLTEAAKQYRQLGLSSKAHLADAYLCASLYFLNREEECLNHGEELLQTLPQSEEEARSMVHNIMGALYGGAYGTPQKTIYHCKQAIPYYKKVKDYRRLLSLYGIIASYYNNKEQHSQALSSIDSAGYFANKANNLQQVAFLQTRRARALFSMNRNKEALASLKTAETYFVKHGSKHGEISWIYGNFQKHYADIGDYQKAFQYRILRDSVSRGDRIKENDKAVSDLMVKYETEKKEHQIQMQALTIDNERQRSQQIIWSAIGGLAFLSLFFTLGYFYYRNQQQEKLRQTQLKYQEQLLTATVNTQEAERKRIARDLHDGIGQQLTGLKMGFQVLAEKWDAAVPEQDEQLQKLSVIISNAATDVRQLSHQMMPKALAEFGLVPAIGDMLDSAFGTSRLQYTFEHHGLKKRLPEDIEIGIYRIAQELVNNILKHSGAKEVEVQLMKNKKQLLLIVEDDGRGFKPLSIKNEGHGMTNIRSRLQAIKGEVNFECPKERGTIATIRVVLEKQKLA